MDGWMGLVRSGGIDVGGGCGSGGEQVQRGEDSIYDSGGG